jgi:hypothetical protein
VRACRMNTSFPARPCDVAALTVREFTSDLDLNKSPSVDEACQRFLDDANRALVWLIRVRALRAWCARPDIALWLHHAETNGQSACEAAASFSLNEAWEFEAGDFRVAVESIVARRFRN